MIPETNYSSGEDYEIEFLGFRFAFNAFDFEQRVTAAAVKLGLLEGNELDDDETADLVELVHRGLIDEPRSGLVGCAAAGAALWGLLGLTVLPRLDVAGALGVPLLLLFLWRSESRAAYAGVFAVVAVLELYGTAIGTWRWNEALPGLGIPDGNPPSGAASGYGCFDVGALLLAPRLLALVRGLRTRLPAPAPARP